MKVKIKFNGVVSYGVKIDGNTTFRDVVQSFCKNVGIPDSGSIKFNHNSTEINRDDYAQTLNTLFPNKTVVKLYAVSAPLKHSNLTPLYSGSIFETRAETSHQDQKIKKLEAKKERILEEQKKILADIKAKHEEAEDVALQLALEISRLEVSENSSPVITTLPANDATFTPDSDRKRKRSDAEEQPDPSKRIKKDETKKSETKGKKKVGSA